MHEKMFPCTSCQQPLGFCIPRAVLGLTQPMMSSVRTSGGGFFPQNFLVFQLPLNKGQNLMVVALHSAASAQLFWPWLPNSSSSLGKKRLRVRLLFTKNSLVHIKSQKCCGWWASSCPINWNLLEMLLSSVLGSILPP